MDTFIHTHATLNERALENKNIRKLRWRFFHRWNAFWCLNVSSELSLITMPMKKRDWVECNVLPKLTGPLCRFLPAISLYHRAAQRHIHPFQVYYFLKDKILKKCDRILTTQFKLLFPNGSKMQMLIKLCTKRKDHTG